MSELPKYCEELCEVKLSSKEIETASDSYVQACNREAAAKIEHKNTMDAIKEIKESAFLLMTKKRESRLVRCLAEWNYPVSGRVTLTRTDTQEVFERKMTAEEVAPFLPAADKKDLPQEGDLDNLEFHSFDESESADKAADEVADLAGEEAPAAAAPAQEDQLSQARAIFAKHGRSLSALQRHLGISLGKALEIRDQLDAETPAADAPAAESPAAETPAADAPAAESQAADAPAEDLEVLCDNCGHYFQATGRVTDFPHLDCPKCDKGNLDPDQVKARDFAIAWKTRFGEIGYPSYLEPHRGSDIGETCDHLYRYDFSSSAFCGFSPSEDHDEKYPRKPGFPPDHHACPACIRQGHRVIDKIIEGFATETAKTTKPKKAKKDKAAPSVPEETQTETQEG